jgi:anaerobic carbon-monoxide dehydrogenase iron sulfur subunit
MATASAAKTVLVNPERCIGCMQCEIACAVEHSQSRDLALAVGEDPPPRTRIHVEAGPAAGTAFPNRCRHCEPAPCMQVCPTAAIHRDVAHDLVLIDEAKCIDCAMCAMVCPFDVLTFHVVRGGPTARVVAVKCDGCADRVRRGETPACVDACKVDALVYGEINELVAAGRMRETSVVLNAASPAVETATDGMVRAWRAYGAELVEVDARAASADGGHAR